MGFLQDISVQELYFSLRHCISLEWSAMEDITIFRILPYDIIHLYNIGRMVWFRKNSDFFYELSLTNEGIGVYFFLMRFKWRKEDEAAVLSLMKKS